MSKQKKSSYLQRTTQSSPNLNTTQSSCTADHKQHHAHNLQTNKHLQKQKHTTPPSTSTAGSLPEAYRISLQLSAVDVTTSSI
jgi:hypothetical protein